MNEVIHSHFYCMWSMNAPVKIFLLLFLHVTWLWHFNQNHKGFKSLKKNFYLQFSGGDCSFNISKCVIFFKPIWGLFWSIYIYSSPCRVEVRSTCHLFINSIKMLQSQPIKNNNSIIYLLFYLLTAEGKLNNVSRESGFSLQPKYITTTP